MYVRATGLQRNFFPFFDGLMGHKLLMYLKLKYQGLCQTFVELLFRLCRSLQMMVLLRADAAAAEILAWASWSRVVAAGLHVGIKDSQG